MGKKYYIIYKTRNLKNGKIYIGMHETNNLDDGYLGSGTRLKRAIRYYGKEFFEREILHYCKSRDDMLAKEVEIVDEAFVNRKDTYNLMLGGKGGTTSEENLKKWLLTMNDGYRKQLLINPNLRYVTSEKSSKRMTQMHKDGIIKYDNFKNKKHKSSSKLKMSKKAQERTGSKNSQFNTMWITNGNNNMKINKASEIPEGWYKGRKIKRLIAQ